MTHTPFFSFQFLIGRLDTADRVWAKVLRIMFQFLIGRLDTRREKWGAKKAKNCFNSS